MKSKHLENRCIGKLKINKFSKLCEMNKNSCEREIEAKTVRHTRQNRESWQVCSAIICDGHNIGSYCRGSIRHCIPEESKEQTLNSLPFQAKDFYRAHECQVLLRSELKCTNCTDQEAGYVKNKKNLQTGKLFLQNQKHQ